MPSTPINSPLLNLTTFKAVFDSFDLNDFVFRDEPHTKVLPSNLELDPQTRVPLSPWEANFESRKRNVIKDSHSIATIKSRYIAMIVR